MSAEDDKGSRQVAKGNVIGGKTSQTIKGTGGVQEAENNWMGGDLTQEIDVQRVDLAKLAAELAALSGAVRNAKHQDASQNADQIDSAATSARSNDRQSVLAKLRNVSKWVVDTARALGIDLAAKVIAELIK